MRRLRQLGARHAHSNAAAEDRSDAGPGDVIENVPGVFQDLERPYVREALRPPSAECETELGPG